MTARAAVVGLVLQCGLIGCRSGERSSATDVTVNAASTFPHSSTADSLLSAGQDAYKGGEYDSARMLLEKGRVVAAAAGDSISVARGLTELGLTAWRQGSYDVAKQAGEQALAMKLRLGLKSNLFRSYNALGLLAHAEGRLTDAAALFTKARAAAIEVNDSISIAKAIGNLGLVHADAGDLDAARTEFKSLATAAHAASDTVAEGNALANLGMVEVRNGDGIAAIQWLLNARKVYGHPEPAQEENILGQLGTAYSLLGDDQRAIVYVDSALRVARDHDLMLQEAEDLEVFAELLGEAGDHQRALQHLTRARTIADSIGATGRAGEISRSRAREQALVSRFDLARASARDAIIAHKSSGFRLEEMRDYLLLAEISALSRRSSDAEHALRSADSLAALLKLPIAHENVVLVRARAADVLMDPASVLRALPPQELFARSGPLAQGEAFALRARSFGRLGQWPEAVSAGQQAIARLEGMRQKLGEGPLRASFVSDQSGVYADLVIALLRMGRTSEAFEVADAARGKSLLEHIAALSRTARTSTADLAESQRLLRRIDWLTEQLKLADTIPASDRGGKNRFAINELSVRLADARRDYEDRIKSVAMHDPRGAALIGISSPHTATIRSALGPSELLLEYMATPNGLIVFAANRDSVQWIESHSTIDELAPKVRLATELASRRGAAARSQVFRALYDELIAPIDRVAPLSRYRSLIIVPHSVLAFLPFSALVDHSARYLIEDHSIAFLPSASALPYLRGPAGEAEENQSRIFAPFPETLPGSRIEAVAVRRAAPRPSSFIGARATERELRDAFAVPGIVHIASHAEVNHANPMFSMVELARGRTNGAGDDGRFEVHELLSIPVKSRLVFLSGCETGAGSAWSTSFRRAQDYATLSQAFLYSGARDVVATLWRIDDRGAAVFAARFYSELAAHSPEDALATAQRAMIKDPAFSSPRYWAAYTISGRGSDPGRAILKMSSVK